MYYKKNSRCAYYLANKEKLDQYQKKYYEVNKNKINQYYKHYYFMNKKKINDHRSKKYISITPKKGLPRKPSIQKMAKKLVKEILIPKLREIIPNKKIRKSHKNYNVIKSISLDKTDCLLSFFY